MSVILGQVRKDVEATPLIINYESSGTPDLEDQSVFYLSLI